MGRNATMGDVHPQNVGVTKPSQALQVRRSLWYRLSLCLFRAIRSVVDEYARSLRAGLEVRNIPAMGVPMEGWRMPSWVDPDPATMVAAGDPSCGRLNKASTNPVQSLHGPH